MKFFIHTFGCQMNESDSEHIAGILLASGMTAALSPEESNLIIINTCAVREKSEEKLYSLLGRLESLKKTNGAIVGVTGCIAQLYRSKLWDKKPFLDFIIGPDNYRQIPKLIPTQSNDKVITTHWDAEWHDFPIQKINRNSKVSAYLTIMEGCNNFCSYCVVPFTRGREKYRPIQSIHEEAEELAARNYKEIHLLGQNVNSYIDPETGKNCAELLKNINTITGIE